MSEQWVDFTPPPPRPPKYLDNGEYICIIRSVQDKQSFNTSRRFWQWVFEVKDMFPPFRLYYVTTYTEHPRKLAELIKACTGKKPKTKILVKPVNYIGVTIRVGVKKKIVGLQMVNEITYVKHL